MSKFEAMIDSIIAIDDSKSRSDILLDLEYTKSANETINRIFDGNFLKGVQRKPESVQRASEDALIILDSDEEEEQRSELRSPELPTTDDFGFLEDTPPPKKKDAFGFIDGSPLPKNKDAFEFIEDTPSPPQSKDPFDFLDYTPPPKKNDVLNSSKDKRTNNIHTSTKRSYLDDTPSPKMDALDFLDDDLDMTENRRIYDVEDEFMSERTRPSEKRLSLSRSPQRHVSLDSLEELSPIRYTVRPDERPAKNNQDSFSFETTETHPDDDDNFLGSLSLKPNSRKRKASPPSSISLIDSDSDESLPSVKDFFDQLMSQQKKKPDRKGKQRAFSSSQVSESLSEYSSVQDEESISNFDQLVSQQKDQPDRKGKQRAYSSSQVSESLSEYSSMQNEEYISNFSLSVRERKKMETAERKRLQAEERKRAADEKKRKREELLEEKKRIKELKALEKERTAIFEKENKVKSNRGEVIKEMIVELHPDFIETKAGELLKTVLGKKETVIRKGKPALYHLIWRRICKSEWDEDSAAFIPYQEPKIVKEPFVLVYVDIYEFFGHIQEETTDTYVDNIKRAAGPGQQVILLIEGLQAYYKKKMSLERRIFDERVRSTIEGSTTSKRKSQPEIENGPNRKQVEESINYLIIQKGIMFVLTKNDEDTANWIESLTTDLAMGRYKLKNLNASYKSRIACTDPSENYNKILQEIQLCTQPVAISVMKEYKTLQALHEAYERSSKTAGERLLADLDVERSVLNPRDRKVNRTMSKRIYQIFSSTDPNEIID